MKTEGINFKMVASADEPMLDEQDRECLKQLLRNAVKSGCISAVHNLPGPNTPYTLHQSGD